MTDECKLCGGPVGARNHSRCHCGWRLDDECRVAHQDWCPTDGRDAWLGAHEI